MAVTTEQFSTLKVEEGSVLEIPLAGEAKTYCDEISPLEELKPKIRTFF
jgi:hypothetical protein